MTNPVNLTLYFSQEVSRDDIAELFSDPDGCLDSSCWSPAIEFRYAERYVERLDMGDKQFLLSQMACDTVAFRYYAILEAAEWVNIPAGYRVHEELRALYLSALAVVMAEMFRFVQRKREQSVKDRETRKAVSA